jgi:hypothetical protein
MSFFVFPVIKRAVGSSHLTAFRIMSTVGYGDLTAPWLGWLSHWMGTCSGWKPFRFKVV